MFIVHISTKKTGVQIMSSNQYKQDQAGSVFHYGNPDSDLKIVMLHGNGRCAEEFQKVAEYFDTVIPDSHILIPNGAYKIPEEHIPEEYRKELKGRTPYTWFNFEEAKNPLAAFINANKDRKKDVVDDCIEELTSGPSNRVYLFGFSLGGIRAAGDFAKAAQGTIKGAVLHSSAITSLGEINSKSNDKNAPARLLTVMGKDDDCMPGYIMKPLTAVHYYNQLKLRFNGVSARSEFIKGLGHEISEESAILCATHIKKLDNYIISNQP